MQDLAVFVIVGAAATYLVRSWWLMGKGEKGCGGCNSCPASKATPAQNSKAPQLVQIDLNGSWKK